jgi:diketogulonate reductase-like aldo/keto reductase
METLAQEGKVRFLGVSNCHLEQIVQLVKGATVKPTFLQNRCYATTLWDRKIREFCSQYNIIYQGFSLLTANANSIVSGEVKKIAQKYSKTIPQIIFRFSLDLGMLPLTGTTQKTHMLEDLQIFDFELTREEIEIIERIAP